MHKFNSLIEMRDSLLSSDNDIFKNDLSVRFFIGYEKLIDSRFGSHIDIEIFDIQDKYEATLEIFDEICSEISRFNQDEVNKNNFQNINIRLYVEEKRTYEELFYAEIDYNTIESIEKDVEITREYLLHNSEFDGDEQEEIEE